MGLPFFKKNKDSKQPEWIKSSGKGFVVGKSPPGFTRSIGRDHAELDARKQLAGDNGSATIRGGNASEYWTTVGDVTVNGSTKKAVD